MVLSGMLVLTAATAQVPEITIDPGNLPPEILERVIDAIDSIAEMADDVDGGEGLRLRRRARDVTVTTLNTEGYFSPVVNLDAAVDEIGRTWDITINPGPRTVVHDLDLGFDGAIGQPRFEQNRERLRQDWLLQEGKPFRNAEWESSKSTLVTQASATYFPIARLTQTAAEINADEAQGNLIVKLDSGPSVSLGEIRVKGLKRVPQSVIERYIRYERGQPYERRRMVDWQQDLQASPFFTSVKVDIARDDILPKQEQEELPEATGALDPAVAEQAETLAREGYTGPEEVTLPIEVEVVESRPRRMSVSLGIDDEVGPRIETVYRQNIVAGFPVELETGLRLDPKRKLGYADIHLIPHENGYRDSFGVLAQDVDIEGVHTKRMAVGAIRRKTFPPAFGSRVEYEVRYGTQLARESTEIDRVESYNMNSLIGTADLTRRDVNDKFDPREGHVLGVGAGLGTELGGSNRFGRLTARGQYWWSPRTDYVLTTRLELGRVWTRNIDRVPDDFSFRTGGASTVRGYSYLGLGREVGGAIRGDLSMIVASLEGTKYFSDILGGALFIDTGNVSSSFGKGRWSTGVGGGIRVKTPAGPLQVDLAYGLRTKDIRLHFALGVAF